eukprot:4523084-Prymnesium_polylepis.2
MTAAVVRLSMLTCGGTHIVSEEKADSPAQNDLRMPPLAESHRPHGVDMPHEAHTIVRLEEIGLACAAKVRVHIHSLGGLEVLVNIGVQEIGLVAVLELQLVEHTCVAAVALDRERAHAQLPGGEERLDPLEPRALCAHARGVRGTTWGGRSARWRGGAGLQCRLPCRGTARDATTRAASQSTRTRARTRPVGIQLDQLVIRDGRTAAAAAVSRWWRHTQHRIERDDRNIDGAPPQWPPTGPVAQPRPRAVRVRWVGLGERIDDPQPVAPAVERGRLRQRSRKVVLRLDRGHVGAQSYASSGSRRASRRPPRARGPPPVVARASSDAHGEAPCSRNRRRWQRCRYAEPDHAQWLARGARGAHVVEAVGLHVHAKAGALVKVARARRALHDQPRWWKRKPARQQVAPRAQLLRWPAREAGELVAQGAVRALHRHRAQPARLVAGVDKGCGRCHLKRAERLAAVPDAQRQLARSKPRAVRLVLGERDKVAARAGAAALDARLQAQATPRSLRVGAAVAG